jgi:hypothetical protein
MKLLTSILLATGLVASAQDVSQMEKARHESSIAEISLPERQAAEADLKARYGITTGSASDIGATPQQLKAHYKKLDKTEKAWCGGTAYGFIPSKTSYVYAIIAPGQTTVSDVMYTKFKGEGNFTSAEREILAKKNQQVGKPDWRDIFLPKGRRQRYNELIHNKPYWIQHESINAPATITNNFKECETKDGPDNDNGWHGFEVRTEAQFRKEQDYIRILKAEAEAKYRQNQRHGAVNVGSSKS